MSSKLIMILLKLLYSGKKQIKQMATMAPDQQYSSNAEQTSNTGHKLPSCNYICMLHNSASAL